MEERSTRSENAGEAAASSMAAFDQLAERVIGAAFSVYNTLGFGFLESVYERSLVIELEDVGLSVIQQHPIPVHYRGREVGKFIADLYVNYQLIVELKSVEQLARIHEVQLVNYLKATDSITGLLLNFGPSRVDVKRKFKDKNRVIPA